MSKLWCLSLEDIQDCDQAGHQALLLPDHEQNEKVFFLFASKTLMESMRQVQLRWLPQHEDFDVQLEHSLDPGYA